MERYTTTTAWLRHDQPIVNVEESCELGTRVITLPLDHVIQSAANRHIKRYCHPSYIAEKGYWGNHRRSQPRLTYNGKS